MAKKKKKKNKKTKVDIVSVTVDALGLKETPSRITEAEYYLMSRITSGQLFGDTMIASPPS